MGEEIAQSLLPGIPDEIVLDKIAPKLSWETFYILSSVSLSWQQAIQQRQVYHARVLTHSTETLVVVHTYNCEGIHEISVYSLRDKACHKLPPIRQFFSHFDMPMHHFLMQSFLNSTTVPHRGIPTRSQCIPLDGKIYVLGGYKMRYPYCVASEEVYVFDLCGQGHWKQCASMQEPRRDFGCAVVDGKLYVFGGISTGPIDGVEVYNAKANTWSQVTSMPSLRRGHQVATVGEEIFVYGGEFYDSDASQHAQNKGLGVDDLKEASFIDIYHPLTNEWRKVEPFRKHGTAGRVFMAHGKFHSMTGLDMHVYDIDTGSWTNSHSFSFAAIESLTARPIATLVIEDELLAVVRWYKPNIFSSGSCLLQSKGFGRVPDQGIDKEIEWQKLECSLDDSFGYPSLYTIQI